MKLETHEYSVSYLSVVLPVELRSDENIKDLQRVSSDEYARLKDGIEVGFDSLMELEQNEDGEVNDNLLQFASYLLKNWSKIDVFVFTP